MKHINTIRKINLIGLIFSLALIIPQVLSTLGYENKIWSIAIFGIYLFMFFSFWFFLFFLVLEIKYVIKYKINFLWHITHNKLVLWGIITFTILIALFNLPYSKL